MRIGGPFATVESISCDQCRTRKVRCEVDPDSTSTASTSAQPGSPTPGICRNCHRRNQRCTYAYVHKKSGRPSGRSRRATTNERRSASPDLPRIPSPIPPSSVDLGIPNEILALTNDVDVYTHGQTADLGGQGQGQGQRQAQAQDDLSSLFSGPTVGSIFGSARNTFITPSSYAFNYSLPQEAITNTLTAPFIFPDIESLNASTSGSTNPPNPVMQSSGQQQHQHQAHQQQAITPGQSDPGGSMNNWMNSNEVPETIRDTTVLSNPRQFQVGDQIEVLAPWDDISFFISLHMRNQHVLVPLMHKPSFAQDVISRCDREDETFRCLLISIISYTICQVPVRFQLHRYTRPALSQLLYRCQKASRMIQVSQQSKPSLVLLASCILDWITSQATGHSELPNNLMADVRRIVYSLRLHRETPQEEWSGLEREMARRLFWEAYVIDKTNALNGHPLNIHDAEGLPPLPVEVDDEYITEDSRIPQPVSRLPYMTGFVAIAKIFRIISQSLIRQRTYQNNLDAGPGRDVLLRWVISAAEDLRNIMNALPPALSSSVVTEKTASFAGIQRANIRVTSLCAEFTLLDLKACLVSVDDTVEERRSTAKKAYDEMSCIPLEDLASNGESMRGKVLRIILALLSISSESQGQGDSLWDWWNMYSRVQFISVIPDLQVS